MNLNLCAVIRCTEPPYLDEPLRLCRQHALMVSLNVTDRLHANAMAGHTTTGLDIERVSVALDDVWRQQSHEPVVYFLTNGDRAKIGTSTNITARVGTLSLRRSNAVLLLQGGHDLENALHQHFECDRIAKTEWFVFSPRIQDYIARRKAAEAALRQPVLPDEPTVAPLTTGDSRVAVHVPVQTVRPPTAEKRILEILAEPNTSDRSCNHVHRTVIAQRTGINGSTLDNTLSRMVIERKAHRGFDRGTYGPGPGE